MSKVSERYRTGGQYLEQLRIPQSINICGISFGQTKQRKRPAGSGQTLINFVFRFFDTKDVSSWTPSEKKSGEYELSTERESTRATYEPPEREQTSLLEMRTQYHQTSSSLKMKPVDDD
jgi:hypothetical protein